MLALTNIQLDTVLFYESQSAVTGKVRQCKYIKVVSLVISVT